MSTHVEQAVILAAGLGSRIRSNEQPLPKPLVRVGGLTLIERTILTAKAGGVKKFVIVTGFAGELVQATVAGNPALSDLDITFVKNERYTLKNGVSVLCARPYIRGEFFLMMADHIVDRAIFQKLQREPARGGLVLAVDRKLDTIFDMDDATKVKIGDRESIAEIGKALTDFDAVDTGVFRCDPALFDALSSFYEQNGDASLSEGVQTLARAGKARVADIGDAWWQDVDDLPSRKIAEQVLFASLTKKSDGPVSRHINRRFSKTLTRLVMNTSIVPNHMTALGLVVGIAAAVVTALVTPASLWLLALGAVLYQVSSMIDGCDGEIARLKFLHSSTGEWFDTISDDVINLGYQLALGFAMYRLSGEKLWLNLGVGSFVIGWFVAGLLYKKLIASGKGTHLALEWSFQKGEKNLFARFCERAEFMARRDFYALALMVLVLAGLSKFAVLMSFVTVTLIFVQWTLTAISEAAAGRRENDETSQNVA